MVLMSVVVEGGFEDGEDPPQPAMANVAKTAATHALASTVSTSNTFEVERSRYDQLSALRDDLHLRRTSRKRLENFQIINKLL